MIKLTGKVRAINDVNGHSVNVQMIFSGKDKENQVAVHPDNQMAVNMTVLNAQGEIFGVNKPVSITIEVPKEETKKK